VKVEVCYICGKKFDMEARDNSRYVPVGDKWVPICAGCAEDALDYL